MSPSLSEAVKLRREEIAEELKDAQENLDHAQEDLFSAATWYTSRLAAIKEMKEILENFNKMHGTI